MTMNEAAHVYTPTIDASASAMPAGVAHYLDGTDLLGKTQALRLSTINAAGWPHAALLSAGEILVLSSNRLRFAMFSQSGTVANLARDNRLTLSLSLDGGMQELWLRARRLLHVDATTPLAYFEADLEKSRFHVAPYAAVTSGITFMLHEPSAILPRWERQLAALRAAS
jgi:hypothetical protein